MTDLAIIKKIEEEIGIRLQPLDRIAGANSGYTLDQNDHVTGLILSRTKANRQSNIYSILSKLSNLRILHLHHYRSFDISSLEQLSGLVELSLNFNTSRNLSA